MNQDEVKIKKYVLIFSGYYIVLMSALNILAHGFDIDLGSSADLGILIGSAYAAAIKFVTESGRAPSTREKRLLSLGCLFSSFVLSFSLALVVIPVAGGPEAMEELSELFSALSPIIWISIIVVIGLLYYFLLNMIFGWGARKYAEKNASA